MNRLFPALALLAALTAGWWGVLAHPTSSASWDPWGSPSATEPPPASDSGASWDPLG